MAQKIINLLKLRETYLNKNNFKLKCFNCNENLYYDMQIKKRVCSQKCFNMFYYQKYNYSLNLFANEK